MQSCGLPPHHSLPQFSREPLLLISKTSLGQFENTVLGPGEVGGGRGRRERDLGKRFAALVSVRFSIYFHLLPFFTLLSQISSKEKKGDNQKAFGC